MPGLHHATLVTLATLLTLGVIGCTFATARHLLRETTPVDPAYRLNLNTATVGELQNLPRIGPTTATHIVAWRSAHGPFRNIEDFDQVRLIGPVTLERVGPWITFDPPAVTTHPAGP